jgi:hypothetical protein
MKAARKIDDPGSGKTKFFNPEAHVTSYYQIRVHVITLW